jgi:hypothetical protein
VTIGTAYAYNVPVVHTFWIIVPLSSASGSTMRAVQLTATAN